MSIHTLHTPTPDALSARARVMEGCFTRADAEALMASRATGDYHLGMRVMQTLTREENARRRPVPVSRFTGADSWRSGIGDPERDDSDGSGLCALLTGFAFGLLSGVLWTLGIVWVLA